MNTSWNPRKFFSSETKLQEEELKPNKQSRITDLRNLNRLPTLKEQQILTADTARAIEKLKETTGKY